MTTTSAKKSISLSFYTMISRVLGLLRDHFMATSFGTGMVASAFSVAYRLPNMFRNLLAEGTLSQSFMPIFSSYEAKSLDEAKIMTGSILSFLFFILSVFIASFLFAAPYFIPFLVGGTEEYSNLVIDLSFILFFLIMTASLSSIFMAISNSHEKYFVPSLSPIILNLSYIFVFLALFPFMNTIRDKVFTLSLGVVIGGVLQLIVQSFYVYRLGYAPSINLNWKHPAIKKIFRLMLPAVVGGGFYQLSLLVDIFLANYIQNQNVGLGAVVSLDYAQRLVQLPTGIIGVALATTILPTVLSKVKKGDQESIPMEIGNSFVFSLFLTLPASVGLITLGKLVLDSIYYGGRWDSLATNTTIVPLGFYAIAIPFYSLNKIMISCYYAFQDTKTPLKVQGFTFIFGIIVAISLMNPLKHGSIAFASALNSIATSIILFFLLKKHKVNIPIAHFLPNVMKILIPVIFIAFWTAGLNFLFYEKIIEECGKWGLSHANSSRLILTGILSSGIFGYFIVSYFSGVEEWKILFGRFIKLS